MRSRPKVDLFVPPVAYAGDPLRVALALTARSRTPVDCIELTLQGVEEVARPEGFVVTPHEERFEERRIVDTVERVAGRTVLEPGETRFEHTFTLPADAPATYSGIRIVIRYQVHVHVAIPWWADVDETFAVRVVRPPSPRPSPSPVATTTRASPDAPFLEVTLDDSTFSPGDVISGALAIGNLRGRRVHGVDLALVAAERFLIGGQFDVYEAHRFMLRRAFKELDSRDEGRELSFELPIPATATPSFEALGAALLWGLEVRADLGWGQHLLHTTPVTLGIFEGERRMEGARRPIGTDRWRKVWAEIGARYGLELEEPKLALSGEVHGIWTRVWVEVDKKGRRLVADLSWPSFEIGLEVGPERRSPWRVVLPDTRFSKRFVASGKDATQVSAVLGPRVRRALLAFDQVKVADDGANVCASPRLSGYDALDLEPFLRGVFMLAAALRGASDRIPPPDGFANLVPAWTRFAHETGGRLVTGSMSIRDATFEGVPFAVVTELKVPSPRARATSKNGAALLEEAIPTGVVPLATVVEIAVASAQGRSASADFDALVTSSPGVRALVQELLAVEPRPAASVARPRLRVGERSLAFDLGAPLEQPGATLRPVLSALVALARRLGGDRIAGPYR